MRKILLALALLISPALLFGQQGVQSTIFTATGTGKTIKITGTGIQNHQISWTVTGTVASCSVQVDSSTDGVSWNSGDVIAAQSCTASGSSSVVNGVFNYIRVDMTVFSGSSTPTVTVVWDGFVASPNNITGNATVSGNLTVTGAAYLSSAIVTPGRPGDNTIGSQAGFMVKWDGTNSRWTACDINSTTLCVPTTYTAANSANGTGNRPDGKPACGGGGTAGGAAVCTYTTLSTVTATFDGAVTNGNLACAKSGSTATYLHDCGTAVLASVGSSKQVVGVITSAGSGSPVTATADIYPGYVSGVVTAMSGAATTAVSAGSNLNAAAGTPACVDGSSQLTTTGCSAVGSPTLIYTTALNGTNTGTVSATLVTPGADTQYRLSIGLVQTSQPANCTAGATMNVRLSYVEAKSSVTFTNSNLAGSTVASGSGLSTTFTFSNNAVPSASFTWYIPPITIWAKASNAVSINTNFTATNSCTGLNYTLSPVLEKIQ